MPTIYEKTPAGRRTLSTREPQLSRVERTLLLLIDGRKSDAELLALVQGEHAPAAFASLQSLGLIAESTQPAPEQPAPQSPPAPAPAVAAETPAADKAAAPRGSGWSRLTQGLRSALQAREESPRERAAGLAEVVRCAAVGDAEFFAWLEANLDAVLARDAAITGTMMQRAQALRERIEIADRVQQRVPAYLDYGWTIGRVVESLFGYGRYLHGEALALGMVLATEIGAIQGIQAEDVAVRLNALLDRCGLPTRAPAAPAARWLESLPTGNAGSPGELRCVLFQEIGKPVAASVSRDAMVEALERAGALAG
jgi:hypothetical protein